LNLLEARQVLQYDFISWFSWVSGFHGFHVELRVFFRFITVCTVLVSSRLVTSLMYLCSCFVVLCRGNLHPSPSCPWQAYNRPIIMPARTSSGKPFPHNISPSRISGTYLEEVYHHHHHLLEDERYLNKSWNS